MIYITYDEQDALTDKTQASYPTKRVFLDENSYNILPILSECWGHISGCFYVGLMHHFLQFSEALSFIK